MREQALAVSIKGPSIGRDGTVYFGESLHIWEGSITTGFSAPGYERKLYALHSDGRVKWTFSLGEEDVATNITLGQGGTIYFGTLNGRYQEGECRFYAVNPDGSRKWARLLNRSGTTLSAAIGDDGTVYIGGEWL